MISNSKWVDLLWDCPRVSFIPTDNKYTDFSGNVLFNIKCTDTNIVILFGPEDTAGYFHAESDGNLSEQVVTLFGDLPGFCNIDNYEFQVIWEEFEKEIEKVKKSDVSSLLKSRFERSGATERKI